MSNTETTYLSDNALSTDQQVADVIHFLRLDPKYSELMKTSFNREFADYDTLVWSGSWVDADASNVDELYMEWVIEWVEKWTPVLWEDGEPVLREDV